LRNTNFTHHITRQRRDVFRCRYDASCVTQYEPHRATPESAFGPFPCTAKLAGTYMHDVRKPQTLVRAPYDATCYANVASVKDVDTPLATLGEPVHPSRAIQEGRGSVSAEWLTLDLVVFRQIVPRRIPSGNSRY
jgi:hypothetical protein